MHRLERVLDHSSDKKNVLARASYKKVKIEGVISFIYHTCLSSIEPAQMH